jgi:DNA-binding transcriptional regulator LsrR (DeoR family)
VGDVNLIFINEDGEHVINKIDGRIIRISIDKIRKIKNRIGVGFGDRKVKVIIGALRGKFINILLTDEKTAKKIIVEG